ncbi:MAG TPA: hypothetical protein VMU94_30040 [Streptosporangiaceae bacterium]|nr:hypothetical protein [Streptosporangiaceae bacterium]
MVKIDRSNGAGWQLLTRKLHGALSGLSALELDLMLTSDHE